jgi:hypothetical protein
MWADLLQYLRISKYEITCNSHGIIANYDATMLRKMNSVESLQDLDYVFPVASLCCEGANARVHEWRRGLASIIQAMPKFSDPPVKFVGPAGGLATAI